MLNLKFLKILESFDVFGIISIINCCLIFYMFLKKFLNFLQNRSAIFTFKKVRLFVLFKVISLC